MYAIGCAAKHFFSSVTGASSGSLPLRHSSISTRRCCRYATVRESASCLILSWNAHRRCEIDCAWGAPYYGPMNVIRRITATAPPLVSLVFI